MTNPLTYVFDLDDTICTSEGGDYVTAVPIPGMVEAIQDLHDQGHRVIIHTARGMGSGKDWWLTTRRQLSEWGLAFAELKMDKLSYDVWVDDKAVNASDWLRGQG